MTTTKVKLDSTNLDIAEYDKEKQLLTITFHSGAVYNYLGVSWGTFQALSTTGDPSGYFNSAIKGVYAYDCVRKWGKGKKK